ncbi:hypothetical protein [Microbispora siamensis]|uniref:Conjugal transfer protein TraI n=1 Tax=Microbispora siamensis TaxID=564413 RepID=A0ABQ4GRD7_9ACTN|nr:hypothetical protein [Microbispora siamensis]GIH63992.1 hypothetical protein Msi02_48090 [Microbispora siamensis]
MHDVTGTPEPEDISALISGAEAFLASQQPAPVPAASAAVDGETKRVKALRAEVAEAALLEELQRDDTPLRLDTDRVRERRKKAHEAARLHELAQDPVMRAWQAARMRRVLVTASMVSLALALTWSTAGVQTFAAEGAAMWSPAWIFAWFVEPFMSISLLVVVGAKAYMATRGRPIESKTLTRIELLFLALTLGMNAWRHLPFVADEFSLSALVLHILGPVVAVAVVTALPIILAAFTELDHGTPKAAPAPSPSVGRKPVPAPRRPTPPTASDQGSDTPPTVRPVTPSRGRSLAQHRADLLARIKAGEVDARPSAEAIRKALGCARATAVQLRDELAGGAA